MNVSLKKITLLLLFLTTSHSWAEESFWVFDEMIKTSDISDEYIDLDPIINFFIHHPLRITPDKIFINEACYYQYRTGMEYFTQLPSDKLSREDRAEYEYNAAWIQTFKKFNLNVEGGVPTVRGDWDNTTCPTGLLRSLDFFYHFENKLIFSYDSYKLSYVRSVEPSTLVSDKKIEVLPHQYPYLCYFRLYHELTRSACKELQLTPKLVRTFYIPKDEQIYSIFYLPEQKNNPQEKYEIIFEKKYSTFSNVFELIPGDASLDFFIEEGKFTAVSLSEDNAILDKWQYDGENIYVNDELMPYFDDKNDSLLSIYFSQNEPAVPCTATPFDIESYSFSSSCRYQQDLMQTYNMFVKRNANSDRPINFLNHLTQGKNQDIACSIPGCLGIEYNWINKHHLIIEVGWSGGESEYEFIEKNGQTTLKDTSYLD